MKHPHAKSMGMQNNAFVIWAMVPTKLILAGNLQFMWTPISISNAIKIYPGSHFFAKTQETTMKLQSLSVVTVPLVAVHCSAFSSLNDAKNRVGLLHGRDGARRWGLDESWRWRFCHACYLIEPCDILRGALRVIRRVQELRLIRFSFCCVVILLSDLLGLYWLERANWIR